MDCSVKCSFKCLRVKRLIWKSETSSISSPIFINAVRSLAGCAPSCCKYKCSNITESPFLMLGVTSYSWQRQAQFVLDQTLGSALKTQDLSMREVARSHIYLSNFTYFARVEQNQGQQQEINSTYLLRKPSVPKVPHVVIVIVISRTALQKQSQHCSSLNHSPPRTQHRQQWKIDWLAAIVQLLVRSADLVELALPVHDRACLGLLAGVHCRCSGGGCFSKQDERKIYFHVDSYWHQASLSCRLYFKAAYLKRVGSKESLRRVGRARSKTSYAVAGQGRQLVKGL